uniref:hypothetical protein n=1 Tax=Merotricha bacillata TaxID=658122 RepID=UPI0021155B48|nr:hypothetical protein NQZ01_pgp097 [Merotricha bacillata]UTE94557.1 hypothetical protein MbacPt_p084 [Merotricha bacillata]
MHVKKLMASLEVQAKIAGSTLNSTSIRRNLVKKDNNRFLKVHKIGIKDKGQENQLEFMKELSESIDIIYNTIENRLESTVIPDSSKLYVITNTQETTSSSLNFKKGNGELIFAFKQEDGKPSKDLPASFKLSKNDQLEPLFLKLNSLKSLLEKKLRQVKKKYKKRIYFTAVETFSEDYDEEDIEFWQHNVNDFVYKEILGNHLQSPYTTMVEFSRFCSIVKEINKLYENIELENIENGELEDIKKIKLPSVISQQKIFIKLNELKHLINNYIKTKIKAIIKDINDSSVIDNKQLFSLGSNQSNFDNKVLEETDQTSEVSEINNNEDQSEDLDLYKFTIEDLNNNLSVFFSKLLTLPRRLRLDYYNNYNSWLNSYDEDYPDSDFISSNRIIQYNKLDNRPIFIGMMQKHDAEIYRKYIASENNLDYSLEIKSTTTKLAKKSLSRNNNSFDNGKYGILIIIPRFFEYKKINSKITPSLNYSRYLETGYGMYNMPIYKTKPISKKILFAKNKFVKPKKIFTTLYRKEYKHLYNEYYKQRKANLQTKFFYKFRDDYIDTTKGIVIKEREVYGNKILKIVSKIINKIKTVNQLKIIKNFFIENSNDDGILEKTDLFINKVSRNKNKINNKLNNQV